MRYYKNKKIYKYNTVVVLYLKNQKTMLYSVVEARGYGVTYIWDLYKRYNMIWLWLDIDTIAWSYYALQCELFQKYNIF